MSLTDRASILGTAPIPQGEASLRIDIAVWRPIHSPRLVNYGDYEGMNVSEASDRLVTDKTGYVSLELFRPAAYSLNATADPASSEIYARPTGAGLGRACRTNQP